MAFNPLATGKIIIESQLRGFDRVQSQLTRDRKSVV